MLWEEHQTLAEALRNQALADCLVARFCLREEEFPLLDRRVTLAHVVVAKAQQSVEKLVKGWLLWQSRSFDPTKGHTPFTSTLEQGDPGKKFQRLLIQLNRVNPRIVREVRWLESLAPHPPIVAEDRRGLPQPLTIIAENTEYPFWSASSQRLLTSAEGLSIRAHGVPAIKTLSTFLKVMAQSDPGDFTGPIRTFLDQHPISTEIAPPA